jgi:TRAP-type transport system periplasmic protein
LTRPPPRPSRAEFDLLANRTAENCARMRANGVSIIGPAPSGLLAAPREAARQPVAARKAKIWPQAIEIADWAIKQ